ncbi:MAG: hypothetical protein ACOYNO_08345 [Saprospiraceae bacterium]
MTDNRPAYEAFCAQHHLPLPFQPWWLDAVCIHGHWNACIAQNKAGQTVGVMPYYQVRRWGLKAIVQPPYTAYSGPWVLPIDKPDAKRSTQYTHEQKIMQMLLEQLPRTAYFRQHFHPACTNWFPFYWAGYRQTTRYTHRFNQVQPVENEWKSAVQKKIQRIEQNVHIVENVNFDTAVSLMHQSLQRQGIGHNGSSQALHRLYLALQQREQVVLLGLVESGPTRVVAAQALAFNQTEASFLFSGQVIEPGLPYLNYRLLYEALQWCAQRGLQADLEGSMHAGVEQVFRSMGAERTPYFQVTRVPNRILEAAFILSGK